MMIQRSITLYLTAILLLFPLKPVLAVLTFPVVGTGQDVCYDSLYQINCPQAGQPFHGQNGQYTGIPSSYQDNGDATVTDLVTGLMWQKTPGNKLMFADAQTAADTFALAAYTDWRLPSIKELYSLILFTGIDPSGYDGSDSSAMVPFIDIGYFDFEYGDTTIGERIIDAQYWSSTEYVSTTMSGDSTAFGVNFADGRIKGYPTQPVGPPGNQFTMTGFVRYVRGNTSYGINNYVDNSDSTITDQATGLMWMQADSDSAMNWQQALDYAENLVLAGYTDWRLPDAKELQTIVDYTRSPATSSSAAIDPVFTTTAITDEGGGVNYPFYWSSTTHANWTATPGSFAVYIAFGEALGFMEVPPPGSGNYTLLDVHGAGAQRSDPKSGDPANWPNGNGPQGDVIRIYNYVRCVRDAAALPCCNHDGIRGDADGSDGLDVSDLSYLVDYLFRGGTAPVCYEEGDVDGSGSLDVTDVTYLVDYLFAAGSAPAACD